MLIHVFPPCCRMKRSRPSRPQVDSCDKRNRGCLAQRSSFKCSLRCAKHVRDLFFHKNNVQTCFCNTLVRPVHAACSQHFYMPRYNQYTSVFLHESTSIDDRVVHAPITLLIYGCVIAKIYCCGLSSGDHDVTTCIAALVNARTLALALHGLRSACRSCICYGHKMYSTCM